MQHKSDTALIWRDKRLGCAEDFRPSPCFASPSACSMFMCWFWLLAL